jgi:hypothetical protein
MIEMQDLEEEVLVDKEDLVIGIVIINVVSFVCSPLALKLLVSLVAFFLHGRSFALITNSKKRFIGFEQILQQYKGKGVRLR